MPAKSQSQRGLIFARRDQYGSKKNTPKKWKWIWDEDWENKGKLPKKVKKKKNESVNEAYEVPLDAYINDLFSYMITQGLDENEIDAALNDPDNMDIVQLGAADGLSVEETYNRLDLYNPISGWHNSNKRVNMSEKFIPESIDSFINESADLENQFAESVYDELMERGFTYEEADFAVEQASDIIGELAYEAPHSPGATSQAADWIEKNIFGK